MVCACDKFSSDGWSPLCPSSDEPECLSLKVEGGGCVCHCVCVCGGVWCGGIGVLGMQV